DRSLSCGSEWIGIGAAHSARSAHAAANAAFWRGPYVSWLPGIGSTGMPAVLSGSSAARTVGHHFGPTPPSTVPFVKSPVMTTARGFSSTSAATSSLVTSVAGALFGKCRSESATNVHVVDFAGFGDGDGGGVGAGVGAGVGSGGAGCAHADGVSPRHEATNVHATHRATRFTPPSSQR